MDNLNTKLEKYFSKYKIPHLDPACKEYFSSAMNIALNEYKIPIAELAAEFEVADSVVRRWARGAAVPHPKLREIILGYINEKIK